MERDSIQKRLDSQARQKELINNLVPYLGLTAIFLFFLIVTKGLLVSKENLSNLINQCFTLVMVSIGGAFVYAHGGSDMSIAATCGCGQLVAAWLLTSVGLPLWVCVLACIAITIIGACMTAGIGLIFGVPVFIGSMCIRSVFNGILSSATSGAQLFVPQSAYPYMNSTLLKFAVLLVMILFGYYLFEHTPLGKQDKAIGGNENTAYQAGINVRAVKLMAYILIGLCVGIAAVFQMFRSGSVTAQSGTGLEFNLMLAVILGGMPMRGGEKCRFMAAVLGAVTVAVLENGLVLWGLDIALVNGVKGLLFVGIVGLSYDKSQGKLVS